MIDANLRSFLSFGLILILAIGLLGSEPKELQIHGHSQDFPEVYELGAVGDLHASVQYTPMVSGGWLKIEVKGALSLDCARCLEKLTGDFRVEIKLLLEKRAEQGLEWVEMDDQAVDEYLVQAGPDVTEVSLEHSIAEQIMLNYNLNPLPTLDEENKCMQCGRDASAFYKGAPKAEKMDPRWAKLSSLQKKPRPGSEDKSS